jgi:hypothetical protein
MAAGCNKNNNVSLYGNIQVDGEPLAIGEITVSPADGQGTVVGAKIQDGSYKVAVLPGKKIIKITGYIVTGQRHFNLADSQSPMVPIMKPLAQQTVEFEITGSGTKDFSLTTPKNK